MEAYFASMNGVAEKMFDIFSRALAVSAGRPAISEACMSDA